MELSYFVSFISAAQQSETEDQAKVPKRSFSVRNPRKKPYQKHKRDGSVPFVPPPPPVSYSGKYSQPPSSPESVTGSEFSPRLNRKPNRSLSGSRDNLLTKSFRAMATQLRPKVSNDISEIQYPCFVFLICCISRTI